tara:strand:- start:2210 stop:3541 length:1332 start_codon:yes stop_codon:yes gene_type:complete
MSGNPHITTVTKEDLLTLYRDNSIAALYKDKTFKEAEDAATRVKGIEEAAEAAATSVFTNFERYYEKSRGKRKGAIRRTGNKIIIRQPNGLHSAIQRIIWQEGWKSMKDSPALSKQSQKKLQSDIGKKEFKARTQILHEDKTTVGGYTLAKLYEGVMGKVVDSDFTEAQTTVLANTIGEFFGEITAHWSKDTKVEQYSLSDTLEVPLGIGPQSENPSGSEAYDWKQIRPKLEEALMQEVLSGTFGEEYVHSEGSKPLTERAKERAAHIVVEKIKKKIKGNKSVSLKIVRLTKEAKKKVSYSGKTSDNAKIKKAKSRGIVKQNYVRGAQSTGRTKQKMADSPIALMSLLNAKLPQTVADNMGSPRLENRTGRFAQSVRTTDAIKTPQGFPSIGYTYNRERYGGYESTSGSRFADVHRDPRPLIDQSIREIAASLSLGRLYTRRQ